MHSYTLEDVLVLCALYIIFRMLTRGYKQQYDMSTLSLEASLDYSSTCQSLLMYSQLCVNCSVLLVPLYMSTGLGYDDFVHFFWEMVR